MENLFGQGKEDVKSNCQLFLSADFEFLEDHL